MKIWTAFWITLILEFFVLGIIGKPNKIFSRELRDSTPRFVGPSVRPSVRPSVTLYFFWVFGIFGFTAPAQMIW